MASSSSSSLFFIFLMIAYSSSASLSPNPQQKYDVFISFRGQDTRNSFTSHLYAALCRNKIPTFVDDQLERGSEISQLFKKIEQSKIAVVIFSEDFASSSWCLDELVHILECNKTIVPIFYHVDLSEVQYQSGCFAEAFAKHEEHFKDKVERWRAALTEVAKISGWHSQWTRPESKLVDEIVKDILEKLNYRSSSAGIEERQESICVDKIVRGNLGKLNYRSSSAEIEERISWEAVDDILSKCHGVHHFFLLFFFFRLYFVNRKKRKRIDHYFEL